jgi:hypothetical protein
MILSTTKLITCFIVGGYVCPPQKEIFFMFSYRKKGLLLLAIPAILVATIMSKLKNDFSSYAYSPNKSQTLSQIDESQWPLTDFEAPLPTDPEKRARRIKRSKKYDKPNVPVEPHADYGQSITNNHWYTSIPALPAAQSNVIVVGEILSSQAYLSDNKAGVYSEYSLQVEQVLKDDNNITAVGNKIDLEREGGRIRQPSGRITRYSIGGQNMPRTGKRYLFFLTYSALDQTFEIITGYELQASRIFPLDEAGDKFNLYKGVDETEFLNTVQQAITNPPTVSPK